MLATAWPAPFSDDGWIFEPKWDGVRALVTVDREAVAIRGRRGTDYTDRYPELPVVLLSGVAGEDEKEAARKVGVRQVFDKSGLGDGAFLESLREVVAADPVATEVTP